MTNEAHQLAEHLFRHAYGRIVAVLVRHFGLAEVETAEDLVHDTLVEALEKWSVQGIPENPEGWLMDVAKKKSINLLRRNKVFAEKVAQNLAMGRLENASLHHDAEDSTLRMIFACCHPGLPGEAQVALALKTLCGLSIPEVARALLCSESNINKRLYRAKQRFRDESIAFEIPESNVGSRLENVFTTLYLLFNEGYYSLEHQQAIRMDLCLEAIRLLREVLTRFEHSPEGKALLALMLFNVARFESRLDSGALVLLSEQKRQHWDQELIAEGMALLHSSLGQAPNKYQLQAGIAAEHCLAPSFKSTNWPGIYRQYLILETLDNSVMVKFNKCIAKFFSNHQHEALADLLNLSEEPALQTNPHYHATIGVCYQEMGEVGLARPYFNTAIRLTSSEREKAILRMRRRS